MVRKNQLKLFFNTNSDRQTKAYKFVGKFINNKLIQKNKNTTILTIK